MPNGKTASADASIQQEVESEDLVEGKLFMFLEPDSSSSAGSNYICSSSSLNWICSDDVWFQVGIRRGAKRLAECLKIG